MKKLLFVWLLALISLTVFGQQINDKPLPTDPEIIKGKLDNGLTYYIRQNKKPENRIFLRLVVNAGSVCEDDDQQGLAHFTEHMAFNGTKNFPKHRLIDFLESIGMKFGADLNAYTSFDETVYMLEIPADNPAYLDTALLILHDWAHYLLLEDEEIDKERGVILEEWRLGRGAQERLMRKTIPVILYGSKYAERLPIGKPEIIKNFKYDVLKRFYYDWYRPDLQAVIVVGDVDPKLVEQKIKKVFAEIPPAQKARPRVYPPIPEHSDIKAVVATDKEAPRAIISFYWKHPMEQIKTQADYRQHLINQLVGTMLTVRFTEQIMKLGNPFAFAFAANIPMMDKTDAFVIMGLIKKNKGKEAAKKLMEMVESARRFGFTQSELDVAKKQLLKQAEKMYKEKDKTESNRFVQDMQENFLVRHTPLMSIEQEYNLINQLLPTITTQDVNNAIKTLVTDKNLVITLTGPDDQQYPTDQELIQIVQQVRQSEVKPYKEAQVAQKLIDKEPKPGTIVRQSKDEITGTTEWILSNGIRVVFKPTDFKNDQILLKAYSLGGYSLYKGNKLLNARVADLLVANSGLGKLDKVALDKYLMGKNVDLSPEINLYTEGFSGSSSVKDFQTLLQMIYLYFTAPRFDKEDYKATIEQQIALLQNQANDPTSVWYDTIRYYLGGRTPYAKPLSIEDYKKVNIKKAYKIFKERFSDPGSFTFIFVGNVNPDSVKPLILKYLGGLPAIAKKEAYRNVGAIPPMNTVIHKYVKKGSDPKSMAYMIFTGKTKVDLSQEILLDAVSEILTKRLLDQIREEQSLTYSIAAFGRTTQIPEDYYTVSIFYSSKPDTVEYIVKQILEIAQKMYDDISDEEYKSAVQKLLRSYEVNIKKNKYWLNKLTEMYITNGKPDFVTEYKKIVNDLKKEDLQRAAKRFFNPKSYILIALKPEHVKN